MLPRMLSDGRLRHGVVVMDETFQFNEHTFIHRL